MADMKDMPIDDPMADMDDDMGMEETDEDGNPLPKRKPARKGEPGMGDEFDEENMDGDDDDDFDFDDEDLDDEEL